MAFGYILLVSFLPFFLFLLFSSLLPSFLSRNMFFDPDNDFVWILLIFLLIHMLPQMAGQLPEAQTRDADWRRLRHYTNLGRSSMAIGGNQVVSIHFAGWWRQKS